MLQHILMDFVQIELMYHAKALEMYTGCFQSLNQMDEEEDLEVGTMCHSICAISFLLCAIFISNSWIIKKDNAVQLTYSL